MVTNKLLLHIEGMIVFLLCLYIYGVFEFGWLLFIILLFTPDFSMLGYLRNNRVGAITYNIFHTYTLTISTAVVGYLLSNDIVFAIGLIFTAHIGMDRMLGFGLKYPTAFKDTHLNRV